jgi:Glyoxalase-like domain
MGPGPPGSACWRRLDRWQPGGRRFHRSVLVHDEIGEHFVEGCRGEADRRRPVAVRHHARHRAGKSVWREPAGKDCDVAADHRQSGERRQRHRSSGLGVAGYCDDVVERFDDSATRRSGGGAGRLDIPVDVDDELGGGLGVGADLAAGADLGGDRVLGYTKAGLFDPYFVLLSPVREHPPVILQRVPEAKTAKTRIHFDLRVEDIESEAKRLESLGARRIDIGQGVDPGWIPMADPEGNKFCVCPGIPLRTEGDAT